MEPTPQNSVTLQPKAPITHNEFQKKYWFTSLQMVTVSNPLKEDYPFMVEMRHFIIRAGATERFPGVIANVYLDQMTKIMAQNDDKLAYMADPNLMQIYYDKIIVDVEELVPEYNPTPAYLRNVSPSAVVQPADIPDDTPPWQQNMERARDIAPNSPPPPEPPTAPAVAASQEEPTPPQTANVTEEVTKEFEFDGDKFKMIVNKNDKQMFYKNGQLTSAAEYEKAASML